MHWISVGLIMLCSGCAAPETILNNDGEPMIERMRHAPLSVTEHDHRLPRYQAATIAVPESNPVEVNQPLNTPAFTLLPNPTISIYIYPHIATSHRAPVPGYHTAIKLFERDEYALPGEYQHPGSDRHVQ